MQQDIITAICSGYGMKYYTIEVEGTNVSSALCQYMDGWFPTIYPVRTGLSAPVSPVLITAPTGLGKSTFVLKDLANYLQNKGRILLLTNRAALRLQQRIGSNAVQGLPKMGSYMLEDNPLSSNLDIISYQEAPRYLLTDPYGTINYIRAVVFDEAHFFCSDSTFIPQTSYILRTIIAKFFNVKRIYMTATPEDVKPIIASEEQLVLENYQRANYQATHQYYQQYFENAPEKPNNMQYDRNGNPIYILPSDNFFKPSDPITEYKFPFKYDYVNLHFFISWDSIIQRATDNSSSDKWLIFVRDKNWGEQLKEKIGKMADFVNADIKGEDKKKFRDLVRREWFEKPVLISTTVLYNGVNLKDDKLKHIVVDSINQVEIKQMLGRKRLGQGETVNLYVRVPLLSELEEYKRNSDYLYELTQQYHNNPRRFFQSKWNSKNIDDRTLTLFGVPDDVFGVSIGMSDYAPYQLARVSGDCENYIDNLMKDEKFFQEEVCRWFDKTYSFDMDFGETKEEMRERLVNEALNCVETYMGLESFNVLQCEQLWIKIKSIIYDNKEVISDKQLYKKHNLQTDVKDEDKNFLNLMSDINHMLQYAGLMFKVYKKESKGNWKDWKYAIKRIDDGEKESEEGSGKE